MTRSPTGWRMLMVLFTLTSVVESLAYGHFGAFTPIYLRQLGVVPANIPFWTGILGGVGFVIGLPLLPFWGVWAEKYSRKLVIIRSSYISALLFAIAAASQNVWMLLFARFLVGFVLGNTGVMLALQAEATPRDRLGSVIGIVSSGSPLGVAIGPYLGSLVVERAGIRTLLLLDSALVACAALALTFLIHEGGHTHDRTVSVRRMLEITYHNIVHTPIIMRLFVTYFLAGLGMMLATPFVPLMVERLYNGSALARTIGIVLTTAGLAQAVATPLWGRAGDKLGHLRMLIVCMLAAGTALAGQALAAHLLVFAGWRVAFAIFQGAIGALIMALIAMRVADEQRASVLTMSLLPLQFSWFLGPVLGALLSGLGLPTVFVAAALLTTLATLPAATLLSSMYTQEQRAGGD
ncbi:MAG TPA: MFS transporter [Herpetosiphonaceae bacterium]|nr:MFS transporter [Herpetosiphonaceae bacterium]